MLPADLDNLHYPLLARFYIRRGLYRWKRENLGKYLPDLAKDLDSAMQVVLNSGLGSASPESTALVIFLSRCYLEAAEPSLPDLEAAYVALTFKPHVGEGVKEERKRLEMSFEIANRLCQLYASSNPQKVRMYAESALVTLEHGPVYLQSSWGNHPLKPVLKHYLSNAK